MTKILIVEDDPFLRKAYINILTKENFEVDFAEDGEQGLAKAENWKPDLIMLDMLMPKVDGIEFLRQFDIKGKHPDTKVIAFSNMSVPEKVNEAVALGVSNYKTKAFFSPKEMVGLIRETLASPAPSANAAQPEAKPGA